MGVAVAVYLLKSGEHEISIVEESGRLGRDVSPFYLWRYMKLFRERGVAIMTRATLSGLDGGRAFVTSAKEDRTVEVDDIVVTVRRDREDLRVLFEGSASEVFLLGDARRPRRLHNAIHEAFRMGMKV